MKKALSLILTVLLTAAMFVGCGSSNNSTTPTNTKKLNIGFVSDQGGINDKSFNQSAWEGIGKAEKELGVKRLQAIESTDQNQYEPNLKTMAGQADLTVGCGYMMATAMKNVSSQLPNSKFVIVDDNSIDSPNVLPITFKENEGAFLVGVIAGKTTKTNKVGFIGGMESDVISRFEYGFAAGVASVNPEAAKGLIPTGTAKHGTMVKYADSYNDANKGYEEAKMLYNGGCDIIFHAAGGVGLGLFKAAKEMGKFAIGVDSDQAANTPEYKDVILVSMEKKVGTAVYDAIKDLKDGKFKGGLANQKKLGIKESGVGIAPTVNKAVSKDATDLAAKYSDAIKNGKITVPGTADEIKSFKAPTDIK